MLYHALKYTYITLLHINLRPNPVLGSNTAPEKKQLCACIHRGSALRSVQFLQNEEKTEIVSNRE